tara:strand:- start:725 stop:1138 length:414 start_codon:yes stop_codon:yes gene_type:complete
MTPTLTAAFKNFAKTHARSVDAMLGTMVVEPIFRGRVKFWLGECSQSPEQIVNLESSAAAVCDLIALQLCCYRFSVVDHELILEDLGAAASTLQALTDFLKLVSMHDMCLAKDLTAISHDYARQRLQKIKQIISSRK